MSTEPGTQGLEYLAKGTGKRLTNLVTVRLRTGRTVLQFTDHDRALTVLGQTFSPIGVSEVPFERREAALRGAQVQAYGLIEGQNIKIQDIAGGKFRGADVITQVVDWKYPWIVLSEQHQRLTTLTWTAQTWMAALESLTVQMRRPKGGRFNGAFTSRCPYTAGGEYCKVDISLTEAIGVQVKGVTHLRQKFTTEGDRWDNVQSDGWYHEGEFEFRWAPPELESQPTSSQAAGANVLVDTSQNWTTDEHVGKTVRILNASGTHSLYYAEIAENTSDTLTILGVWSGGFNTTKFYDICEDSNLAYEVYPIGLYNSQVDPEITLYFPTTRNIQEGHSGIVRVGCDGTSSTCKAKFNNILNFGGLDAFAPTPADIIRPPEDN